MNNPDHISVSLETIFLVKLLKFFDADPGSGMDKIRIRYGKNSDPGSATLTGPVDEDGDVVAVLVTVRVLMADYLVDVVAAPRPQAQLPRTWVSLPHKELTNISQFVTGIDFNLIK